MHTYYIITFTIKQSFLPADETPNGETYLHKIEQHSCKVVMRGIKDNPYDIARNPNKKTDS